MCHCNDGFAISDIDKKSCKGMLNFECRPRSNWTKPNLLGCVASEFLERNNSMSLLTCAQQIVEPKVRLGSIFFRY